MKLADAIALIRHREITERTAPHWADLGCGTGMFTYALANLLKNGGNILAIDKAWPALQEQPNPNKIVIQTQKLDFTKELLPAEKLDGILMANSLHFVADKNQFITKAFKHLAENGMFLIVEYDTDQPNPWVPYPVSNHSLKKLFDKTGYASFTTLGTIPSVYNRSNIYAAMIKQ